MRLIVQAVAAVMWSTVLRVKSDDIENLQHSEFQLQHHRPSSSLEADIVQPLENETKNEVSELFIPPFSFETSSLPMFLYEGSTLTSIKLCFYHKVQNAPQLDIKGAC